MRIAVVSPFLDKSHGTERCVCEQIERLAKNYHCHVVVYSHSVTDVSLTSWQNAALSGGVVWRKVAGVRGPQLIRFCWWLLANHLARWWDRVSGRFMPDVLFSPGINCLDASVISVHIIFAEIIAQLGERRSWRRSPIRLWPRLLHRSLYYRLIAVLEATIYTKDHVLLAGVSRKVTEDLARIYKRKTNTTVIYHGVDLDQFNTSVRASLRNAARKELKLPDSATALLLVGNDWKVKGLPLLLDSIARLRRADVHGLIVGEDDQETYRQFISENHLTGKVLFLPPRKDVEWYYAAADIYVGPSLEDAFALPPLEAMACGLPVIVSRRAGVSEIVTHGEDGLVLQDSQNSEELALLIEEIISGPEDAKRMGQAAARTATEYTWDRNTEQLFEITTVATNHD